MIVLPDVPSESPTTTSTPHIVWERPYKVSTPHGALLDRVADAVGLVLYVGASARGTLEHDMRLPEGTIAVGGDNAERDISFEDLAAWGRAMTGGDTSDMLDI